MATSIRNLTAFGNMVTERLSARAELWLTQGKLDDGLRKATMYLEHAEKINDLLKHVEKYQQPADASLNDTLKRVVEETKDFDKFLESL